MTVRYYIPDNQEPQNDSDWLSAFTGVLSQAVSSLLPGETIVLQFVAGYFVSTQAQFTVDALTLDVERFADNSQIRIGDDLYPANVAIDNAITTAATLSLITAAGLSPTSLLALAIAGTVNVAYSEFIAPITETALLALNGQDSVLLLDINGDTEAGAVFSTGIPGTITEAAHTMIAYGSINGFDVLGKTISVKSDIFPSRDFEVRSTSILDTVAGRLSITTQEIIDSGGNADYFGVTAQNEGYIISSESLGTQHQLLTLPFDFDGRTVLADIGAIYAAGTLQWGDDLNGVEGSALRVLNAAGEAVSSSNTPQEWIYLGADNADSVTVTNSAVSYADDVFYMLGGNDTVSAGRGDDLIQGGAGEDLLHGGKGDDSIQGGADNDTITGGEGENLLEGGDGDDVIHSFTLTATGPSLALFDHQSTIYGGAGNDTIYSGDDNDVIYGGDGDDRIYIAADNDNTVTVYGGDGYDIIYLSKLQNVYINDSDGVFGIHYTDMDILSANADPYEDDYYITTTDTYTETFSWYPGHPNYPGDFDVIIHQGHWASWENGSGLNAPFFDGLTRVGYDSNGIQYGDPINYGTVQFAQQVNSTAYGALTIDQMGLKFSLGGAATGLFNENSSESIGAEAIEGTSGNDNNSGGSADDYMTGLGGNDTLSAGDGNDTVDGGSGDDSLSGGLGNDSLIGGSQSDTLSGGDGNDTLMGGDDSDKLYGEDGNDFLNGGSHNDTLTGGNGADTIIGGIGQDTLTGGAGADVFQFTSTADSIDDDGAYNNLYDRITDFEVGIDHIDLSGLGFTGLDTDGGNTEVGELRLAYSSASDRTYVKSDQLSFNFFLDGNYTTTLTANHFTFDTLPQLGTAAADTMTGNWNNEYFLGLGGNDTILGADGADVLNGGAGRDFLTGGSGADHFRFTSLLDSLDDDATYNNQYDGIIDFTIGIDSLDLRGLGFIGLDDDGGSTEAGELQLAYSSASDRTYVRSSQLDFQFYLEGDYTATLTDSDFLFGSQSVQGLGTSSADSLTGSTDAESFHGFGGNDTLSGGSGNDIFDGGAGADRLTGGGGADHFRFSHTSDSVRTSNERDRITDFEVGVDKLDLSALGFTSIVFGSANAGELRVVYSSTSDRTYIRDDFGSDFEFFLDGNYMSTLTQSDFILN